MPLDSITPVIDAMRHSRLLRRVAGTAWLLLGRISRSPVTRGRMLSRAMAFAEKRSLETAVRSTLRTDPSLESPEVWNQIVRRLPRYLEMIPSQPALTRSLMLKAPGAGGEKGVLVITFEYNWARLLVGLGADGLDWLDSQYHLILSASWSPTDYAALALAAARMRGTIFVQSCNHLEVDRIERFHPRLKCVPTLPCDWINPVLYVPKPYRDRNIDILMVANWGEFKRHWELFRALAVMPPTLKVMLIGQQEGGRKRHHIREMARQLGVRQHLEIKESIPIEEVAAHQCDARVSAIMSRREGCCVAAVESLFAGCALGMREDAHVGPLAYINEHTGMRLRKGSIATDLMELLARAEHLDPRTWAVRNISCQISHRRLNEFLKEHSLAEGRAWTSDIILPQWHPHPTFARKEDQDMLAPAYHLLHERFPSVFSNTLLFESWR